MHAAVHTTASGSSSSSRGLSSGPSTPLQKSKANSESGLSMPTSKSKKRERAEQQLPDQSKREKSTKSEDSDSVHSRREQAMKLEDITAITDKDGGGPGGLLGLASVDRLVSLMRQQESKVGAGGDAALNRQKLAAVIAATDKEECLCQLVHLGGLRILDDWLQEAHRCKGEGGSPKEETEKGGSSSEEVQLILLQALDKLPVDLDALKSCSVGKSVNNLRSHKNAEIQRRARKIVDAWKKRVDAEMKLGDEAYKAGSSYTAASWSAIGAGKQAAAPLLTPPDSAIETKDTLVKEETNNPTWSNNDTKSPASTRSGSIITRNKALLARGHAEAASRKEPVAGKSLPDGGSGAESSSSQRLILRLPNLTRNQTDLLAQSSPSEKLSAEVKCGAHSVEPIPDLVGDNNNEQDPLTSVGDGSSTPLALPPPLPVTSGEKTDEGVIGLLATKEDKNGCSDVVKTESRVDDHSRASGEAASPSSLCRAGAKDSPPIESGRETLVKSPSRQECPGETVLRTAAESLTEAVKEEEQNPTTQGKRESSNRCSPGNMETEVDDGLISPAKCEEEEANEVHVETTGAADSCDFHSVSTSPGKTRESPEVSKIGAGNDEIATVSDEEDALEVACQVAKEVEQELEDSEVDDHQEDGDVLDPEKDKESTSMEEVDRNAGKVEDCLQGMDCSESDCKASEDKREVAEIKKVTGTDIVDISGEQEGGQRMEAIESCRESKPAGVVEEGIVGTRPLFDLNEGAADETPLQGDVDVPPSLVRGSMDLVSVATVALVTATATKGAFTAVPDSLARGRGEVGWKGAATRSAFRPAEPRHQKRPRLLDIDLNIADERLLDESATTLTSQSIVAVTTTNTVNTVPWPVLDLNTMEVDVEEEESEVSTLETLPSTSRKAMWDFDLNAGPSFEEASAVVVDGAGEELVARRIPALSKNEVAVYKTATVTHPEPWFGGPPPSPFFPVSKPPLSFLPIVSPSTPVSYSMSMPAFPFTPFPYPSSSPSFPFSSSSSSSSSASPLPVPFRQSPIPAALPSGTALPYIMGLAAPWSARPSLDLNAGPDTIETDPARQMLVFGASASSSKRFESDTTFDPFRSTFKQTTRH